MRRKSRLKKWVKRISITIGVILSVIIILIIVFQELSLRLLFGIGYQEVYYGNDERGNEIISYAVSMLDSADAETYRSWSVQNTKNGNFDISDDLLQKAMKQDPESISRYYGWLLLFHYHEYEEALEVLNFYDALTPNFSDAPMGIDVNYLKGLAFMQLHQYEEAVQEFDHYIIEMREKDQEDFVDVYTFVQKGRCLSKLGKAEESIQQFKKAIQYYKDCSEAYYFMGLVNLSIGHNDEACRNLSTAQEKLQKGLKSSDNYVEYFHEIYLDQVTDTIAKYCPN